MSSKTKVTIFKGGTKEQTLPVSKIQIPDLWHIAQAIKEHGKVPNRTVVADDILNCWHTAGALLEHIRQH